MNEGRKKYIISPNRYLALNGIWLKMTHPWGIGIQKKKTAHIYIYIRIHTYVMCIPWSSIHNPNTNVSDKLSAHIRRKSVIEL